MQGSQILRPAHGSGGVCAGESGGRVWILPASRIRKTYEDREIVADGDAESFARRCRSPILVRATGRLTAAYRRPRDRRLRALDCLSRSQRRPPPTPPQQRKGGNRLPAPGTTYSPAPRTRAPSTRAPRTQAPRTQAPCTQAPGTRHQHPAPSTQHQAPIILQCTASSLLRWTLATRAWTCRATRRSI